MRIISVFFRETEWIYTLHWIRYYYIFAFVLTEVLPWVNVQSKRPPLENCVIHIEIKCLINRIIIVYQLVKSYIFEYSSYLNVNKICIDSCCGVSITINIRRQTASNSNGYLWSTLQVKFPEVWIIINIIILIIVLKIILNVIGHSILCWGGNAYDDIA